MSLKILIVDDSRTSRLFIQQALEVAGFAGSEFVQASNATEAMTCLVTQGGFRLMVTDINMPQISGIELIREIRSARLDKDLSMAVISSTQSEARDQQLRDMGVHIILEKPINLPKLIAAFGDIIRGAA